MNIFLLFQETGGGFSFSMLLMPLAIVAIFYFLVFVPQKRQKQQLQELITQLKINDEVVTNGGIIGKIKELRETSVVIVSEKSFLEIGKSAIVGKKPE